MTRRDDTVTQIAEDAEYGGNGEREEASLLLTARDKVLFVHLAFVRHLGTEQIESLLFSGKTESIARRRLRRLGAAGYLRRVPYRTSEGDLAVAWALDANGFLAGQRF